MTNYTDIVDTYLMHRHMRLSDKMRNDVCMLMPFFLMDASYQIYCKDIKDYACRHEARKFRNRWREGYRQFYAEFFMAFDADQTDFIVDRMDEFESFINNKVVMLKTAVMGAFTQDAPFEEKKILSSVLASNALSQMAQHIYRDMFRNSRMQKQDNRHIEAVTKNSYEFARHFPVSQNVDITSSANVSAMIDTLCKEVVKFLNLNNECHEAKS